VQTIGTIGECFDVHAAYCTGSREDFPTIKTSMKLPRRFGGMTNWRGLYDNYIDALREKIAGRATIADRMPATAQRTNFATSA
jgi:hypothetical protein